MIAGLRLTAILGLLMLGACASPPVPYTHAGLDKEQWSKDYTQCKRYADREVGYRESSGPFATFDRDEAKKREQAYRRACMLGKGYSPAQRKR